MLHDYGKLILLGLVMTLGTVAGTVLLVTGSVSEAAGVGIITSTVVGPLGYLTGNGVLVRRGNAPSPVLVPRFPAEPEPDPGELPTPPPQAWPYGGGWQ